MIKFTNQTVGYENQPVYKAFKEFFDGYFLERDYVKILSCMADDFEGIGTVEDKVIEDKVEYVARLQVELSTMTTSVKYEIKSISAKEIVEDEWNVMAVLELEVVSGFEHAVKHFLHTTGCFRMLEDGFLVESLHLTKTDEGLKKTQND